MAKKSSDKRKITVDANEFLRTRDALTTVFLSLSSSIDKAVKAYIEHTDLVIAGDATLNTSYLIEPFNAIQQTAQALAAPALAATSASASSPVEEDEEDKKGKKKKKRTERDPNAPRRPLTAYFRYLGEVRPLIAAELQKAGTPHKPGDLSLIATERWKQLSQEEHEPYHAAYRRELVDYKAALSDYLARTGKAAAVPVQDSDEVPYEADPYEEINAADIGVSDSSTDTDSDDSDDSDEMIAPPPPPPVITKAKKSTSPETVMKTPKSAIKKAGKAVDTESRTPMFSSVPPASSKKRKADEAESAVPAEKKSRGRPKSSASEKKEKK